jgi:hypothetical protein
MIELLADILADKIVRTWRVDAMRDIWADVLMPLDRDQAVAAYELLRDTEEQMPSVFRFRQVYRSLDPPEPFWTYGEDYNPVAAAAATAKFKELMATARTIRERAAAYEAAGVAYRLADRPPE